MTTPNQPPDALAPEYDPALCLKNLNDKGLGPACQNLITPFHCDDVTGLDPGYHNTCATAGIYYFPIIVLVCHNTRTNEYRYFPSQTFFTDCNNLHSQDPSWQGAQCYCCCSCLANDTLIAVPGGGFQQIDTFDIGQPVLAGSVTTDGGNVHVDWSERTVIFSQGTGNGGHQPVMVYITFGTEANHDVLCNMDQPFLLNDGKFTTAGKLRPGQSLVDREGNAVPIQMVSIGNYEGGVHHISTDAPWNRDPNGHLLLAGGADGVVAGDYVLQMHFGSLPAELKEDNFDSLPLIGTPEYDDACGADVTRSEALFQFGHQMDQMPDVARKDLPSGRFTVYRVTGGVIPYGSAAFLTPDQAGDVLLNGTQVPISNPIPLALFNSVKAQLTGFYPDILFYYDTLDITPNLYAFEAYGRKIVQVSGGLARLQGFNYEGLFMAMAHGISCFYGGDPKGMFGMSAVGQADAFAFAVISRLAWIGNPFLTYVMGAMGQWQALFDLVDSKHSGGNPKDPLNDPSLACRIQTIQVAAAGGALPECAGGEPLPKIWLQKATAPTLNEVKLTFSLAIDQSADDPANYTLDPTATVTGARRDANTGFIVHLDVQLTAGEKYEITVANLTSILGTHIDPAHASVKFEAPTA